MKKRVKIFLAVISILSLTGCFNSDAVVFSVQDTGKVKVILDNTEGYRIDRKDPFNITLAGEIISKGKIASLGNYNEYIAKVREDDKTEVIYEGTKDDAEYLFYKYENDSKIEYNHIIHYVDTKIYIILSNPTSIEKAEEIFNLLSFKK